MRQRLYDLLPAYVRFRDAYQGEPLRAVMEAMELPYEAVLDDLEALYAGWFIETCDLWRVPYIGDLLGVRGLDQESQLLPSQRNRVANTLAYRRAKGTAGALERVAQDATGWACHVIEYQRTTAATASLLTASRLTAPRAAAGGGSVDLRRAGVLDSLDGPFNTLAHTADLSPPRGGVDGGMPPLGDRRGFHPQQIGLVLYRLGSAPLQAVRPCRVAGPQADWRRYTFHPLGLDTPLFNPPRTDSQPVHRSREDALPAALTRSALGREVAARRRGEVPATRYLDPEQPAFRLVVRDAAVAHDAGEPEPSEPEPELLAASELGICDLGDWQRPATAAADDAGAPPVRAWVDPQRGRLLLPPETADAGEESLVWVDYHSGTGLDVGGGSYPRQLVAPPGESDRWTAVVGKQEAPGFDAELGVHRFNSLTRALAAWNHRRVPPIPPPQPLPTAPRDGVIRIVDSATYDVRVPVRLLGRRLLVQAANGCSPTLLGPLRLVGPQRREEAVWSVDSRQPTLENRLSLDGLWIEGGVEIAGSASLHVLQCTLDPPRPRVTGAAQGARAAERPPCGIGLDAAADRSAESSGAPPLFAVRIERSVVGPIRLGGVKVSLDVADSILDGGVEAPEGQLEAARSTLLGEVRVGRLPLAVDSLFAGHLEVELRSRGRLLTSGVPEGSRTPPRERCSVLPEGGIPALFTTTTYGHPAYVQLASSVPRELCEGASNGNEMGVYNSLRQSDRLSNLRAVLDEYLPWGMTARVWFAT